jgi:hypothetical protein
MACTLQSWASTQGGSRVTNQAASVAVSGCAPEGVVASPAARRPISTRDDWRLAGRAGVTVRGSVSFAAIQMRRTVECMIESAKNQRMSIIMSIK